jgi:hypothetical protein
MKLEITKSNNNKNVPNAILTKFKDFVMDTLNIDDIFVDIDIDDITNKEVIVKSSFIDLSFDMRVNTNEFLNTNEEPAHEQLEGWIQTWGG